MKTLVSLLVFILFLAFMFVMSWLVGESQAKADYKKEYEQLKMYVRNSLITPQYCEFIKQKFSDIKRYKCKDNESLSALEGEFKSRFEELKS